MAQPSSEQQATQAGLALIVAQDLANAVQHVDPANPDRSALALLVQAITQKYGAISGALSGRYYQRLRIDAGLGKHAARVAPTPGPEQVRKVVDWATHADDGHPLTIPESLTRLDGGVTKLVQDVGRQTVVASVSADPQAKGWARVVQPDGCCYFCALLATRGAVYKTRATASFSAHDHCRCHAEPIFTAYEPSAQIRQWQADYTQATRGVRGSRNQRIAWRRAFEGRTN